MTTKQIATEVLPNGTTWATDLEPFAKFVNGTVTAAIRYHDGWNIFYRTTKRNLTKKVPLEKVGG